MKYKNYPLPELFSEIHAEEAKHIIAVALQIEKAPETWLVKKQDECYKVTVTDVAESKDHTQHNCRDFYICDDLDIYEETFVPRKRKNRIDNAFNVYLHVKQLLDQKIANMQPA